jgi:hypothetical protein
LSPAVLARTKTPVSGLRPAVLRRVRVRPRFHQLHLLHLGARDRVVVLGLVGGRGGPVRLLGRVAVVDDVQVFAFRLFAVWGANVMTVSIFSQTMADFRNLNQ